MKGVDYSDRVANWGAFFDVLKGKGYEVIGRYLSADNKGATATELEQAFARGLSVFFYYETSEQAALGGFARGVAHAKSAVGWLEKLKVPTDLSVCYTVDFDASAAQLAGPVRDYFLGARSVVGQRQIGVYGGWRTIDYIMGEGLASWAVQTEAWSYLNGTKKPVVWHADAAVRQWTVHGPGNIGGIVCDGLDIVKDIPAYNPEGDMDEPTRNLIRYNHVRLLSVIWDQKIIKAKLDGRPAHEIAGMEKEKAEAVAHEKAEMGI